MGYFKDVMGARELLVNLTLREIRGKYRRTILGQLWSLVNPLALMAIYTIVFSVIFRIQPDPGSPSGLNVFALWLLCGLLPWLFFSRVVSIGAGSLVENAGLITKVYFPRLVLPISSAISTAYSWLFEMGVLIVALAIAGSFVWPWLPLVIVAMALMLLFASGLALLLSVANVHFRDTEHFLGLLLQIWMYLSPIIYPMSLVTSLSERQGPLFGSPVTIEGLYALNPMVHFVAVFRSLLYDNRFPDPWSFGLCAIWGIGAIVIGLLVFRRAEKNLAEAL